MKRKCKFTHSFNTYFIEFLLNARNNVRQGIAAVNKTEIDSVPMEFTF